MNNIPQVNTGVPALYVNPMQAYMQNLQQMQAAMMGMNMQTPVPQPIQPSTTPPMIHCDMIEVESVETGRNWPVNPGQTQTFYTRDDQYILIKTAFPNGGFDFEVFAKQAPEPAPEYMTREQVEALIRSAANGDGKREKRGGNANGAE